MLTRGWCLVAEIDSNFSRAHRIVTTSILPLVEQYGEHSRSVWEASKVCRHLGLPAFFPLEMRNLRD